MTRGFLVKKPVGDILLWSERGSGLAGCVTEDGCPSRVDVVFRSLLQVCVIKENILERRIP